MTPEQKILAVLKDNTTPEESFKVLWRMSKGSRSSFISILKGYTKLSWWQGISEEDFDYAFNCVLADHCGDGCEIDWITL